MTPSGNRIAVLAAMSWECRPVLRSLNQVRRTQLGSLRAWTATAGSRSVVVVKTGMGMQHAGAAAAQLVAEGDIGLLISTGCAGGLGLSTATGDTVIADSAFHGEAQHLVDASLCEQAVGIARAAGLTAHHGPVLCVDQALSSRAGKAAAAARGMIAVEMEGAAIAQHAAAAGIPYLSVRTILDDADTELRDGDFIDPINGRIKPLALVRHLAAQPGAVAEIIALKPMMRAAERSLEVFFRAWFEAAASE